MSEPPSPKVQCRPPKVQAPPPKSRPAAASTAPAPAPSASTPPAPAPTDPAGPPPPAPKALSGRFSSLTGVMSMGAFRPTTPSYYWVGHVPPAPPIPGCKWVPCGHIMEFPWLTVLWIQVPRTEVTGGENHKGDHDVGNKRQGDGDGDDGEPSCKAFEARYPPLGR